jgi:glyoxylase I family protein
LKRPSPTGIGGWVNEHWASNRLRQCKKTIATKKSRQYELAFFVFWAFQRHPALIYFMQLLEGIHHVAIICSDYERSKEFYTEMLGFSVSSEIYRPERKSYKLDLRLNGQYTIELFSFPGAPERITRPEACGLRHIAFKVANVEAMKKQLEDKGLIIEEVRIDEWTGKNYTFFCDPDGLPIELYEI